MGVDVQTGAMDGRDREASASRLADTKQAGGKRRRWPEELKREIGRL